MKELSVEEKAKRYDLAIEVAEKYHNGTLKDVMEAIFPELKESEDDVVIRALKSGFRLLEDEYNLKGLGGLKFEKILAWLEKEAKGNEREIPNSEQKPAEWSKEDEQYLLVCKNALAKYQVSDKWDANIISLWLENRLKSLKDRYTWKPSESDIRILEQVIDGTANPINYHATLHAILEKLKKLREE